MDNLLKALIAVTCFAIIAIGGYFVWNDWQERKQEAEDEASLYRFLDAEPGDIRKATQTCQKTSYDLGNAANLGWDADAVDHAQKVVAVCETNGFL